MVQKQPFLVLTHLEEKVVISFLNQSNHWSLHIALELYRKWCSDHKSSSPSQPHIVTTNVEHVATEKPLRAERMKAGVHGQLTLSYFVQSHKRSLSKT